MDLLLSQELLYWVRETKKYIKGVEFEGWDGIPLPKGQDAYHLLAPVQEKTNNLSNASKLSVREEITAFEKKKEKENPFPPKPQQNKRFVPTPVSEPLEWIRHEEKISPLQPLEEKEINVRKERLEQAYLSFGKQYDQREEEFFQNTTFAKGKGNLASEILVIREQPGFLEFFEQNEEEDPEWKVLSQMFQSIGISMENVYSTFLLKYRETEKRQEPTEKEILFSSEILKQEIQIVKPSIVFVMGYFATQWLMEEKGYLSHFRGKWHVKENFHVLATFQPLYLLRTPLEKKKAWQDMKKLLKQLRNKGNS